MVKKVTTKKKKPVGIEFKVRPISNGYTVTVWDVVEFTDDKVIYCHSREAVLDLLAELVF